MNNLALTLFNFFFINHDVAAIKGPSDKNPRPVKNLTKDELSKLLESSITGKKIDFRGSFKSFKVGTYLLNQEGYIKIFVFDIDGGPDHSDPLLDPDGAALKLYLKLEDRGLNPYLVKSGGGYGWHVICFFEKPLLAKGARRFAKKIVNSLPEEYRKTKSGKIENTIEQFPKQDIPEKLGSMIWLPGYYKAKNGGGKFYNTNFEAIEFPTEFRFSKIPEDIQEPLDVLSITEESGLNKDLTQWKMKLKEWRDDALNGIDLSLIYGPYLTSKEHGNGYLEVHDFRSPSGDKNPSAGVYFENDGEHERGYFHSFRDGQNYDLFQYMIETGQSFDFKDACIKVAELTRTETSCPFLRKNNSENSTPQATSINQVEAQLKSNKNPLEITPFDFDLVNGKIPKRDMLLTLDVPGENPQPFLPCGIIGMLTGPGGTFKTQILTGLAVAVSLGEYFLEHIKVSKPGRVLLILAEEDNNEIIRRVMKYLEETHPDLFNKSGKINEISKIQKKLFENLKTLPLKGQRTPFINEAAHPTDSFKYILKQVIETGEWSLIIIDPLVQVGEAGTETDNHLATSLIQVINKFTTETTGNKTTILVSHHVSQSASRGGAGQTASRGVT